MKAAFADDNLRRVFLITPAQDMTRWSIDNLIFWRCETFSLLYPGTFPNT